MIERVLLLFVVSLFLFVGSPFAGIAEAMPPSVPLSTWPMFQYTSSHNAVFARDKFRVTWVAAVGAKINGGIAIVRDTVYVVSFDHRVYAFDLDTGHQRWSSSANNVLMSTPIVARRLVIVGSGHDGFLRQDGSSPIWGRPQGDDIIAFDATDGRRMWSFHTQGEDMPSPVLVGDTLLVVSGDLNAYAINVETGRQQWREPLPGIDTMASLTAVGNTAFISLCRDDRKRWCGTIALDARNGRKLWTNDHGGSDASPSYESGTLYVDAAREEPSGRFDPGGRDVVAAIDARSGKTRWEHAGPLAPYAIVGSGSHDNAGTVVDGVLYQAISNGDAIVAFDAHKGTVLWKTATLAPVKMSPVVARDRLFFGDIAGVLYSLDRKTGRIRRTGSFKDPFTTSPPVVVGDTLLIVNGNCVFAIPTNTL